MGSSSHLLHLAVFLAVMTIYSYEALAREANFCGMKDPDPDSTCVSLRLPWQEEPIYFCTEKSNFKYRNQCGSYGMHCPNQWSKEVLLLATPWDCCPISSIPDNCVNVQCPPKPLNRTCEVVPTSENNPWDCCPKYFCDESGRSEKDCRIKQLEPGCITPPKGKTNCVPFVDTHGCCTQYQCDGDGKPGMCPMQMEAVKYSANAPKAMRPMAPSIGIGQTDAMSPMDKDQTMPLMAGSNNEMRTAQISSPKENLQSSDSNKFDKSSSSSTSPGFISGPGSGPSPNFGANNTGGVHGGMTMESGVQTHMGPPPPPFHHTSHPHPHQGSSFVGSSEKYSYGISVGYGGVQHGVGHIPCVGDYNCPGLMKCCSNDVATYSDNSALMKNTHPTHGFCSEPVMM